MPSTFPEAFGMVAAEAAACGALPVVAGHSGMAEVAPLAGRGRRRREVAPWLTFEVGPGAVDAARRRAGRLARGARGAARAHARRDRRGGARALLVGRRRAHGARGRPGELDEPRRDSVAARARRAALRRPASK